MLSASRVEAKFSVIAGNSSGDRSSLRESAEAGIRACPWCSMSMRARTWTLAIGYTLNDDTLDNNKNPTDGLLVDFKQDFAGAGGDVTYLKTALDTKYYTPLVSEIVNVIHLQGGILNKIGNNDLSMLDHFQMGPNLVRGFAPTASVHATSLKLRLQRRCARRYQILGRVDGVADAVLVPAEGSRPQGRGLIRHRPGVQVRWHLVLGGDVAAGGCGRCRAFVKICDEPPVRERGQLLANVR